MPVCSQYNSSMDMVRLNLADRPRNEFTAETEFKKESFWAKRLSRRFKEKIAAGMMLGATLMGPGAAVEARGSGGQLKEDTEISTSTKPEWPGGHSTFFTRDESGEKHFNPWALIAPFQVELGVETTRQEKTTFEVPYEYSRLFDSGEPLNPGDHQKLAEYIDQKLKQEFADKLYGFGFSEDVYKTHHSGAEEPADVQITGMSITGFASPEGPQSKGPDTLKPGFIDVENLNLAMKRAETAMGLTSESLKKLGLTVEELEDAAKRMNVEEVQFSDAEMSELADLAAGENGADPLEKIFNLTVKYNDGQITDPAVLDSLDEIIGSKRKIKITVNYEADQKKVVLIPVPWLVFLPLFRRRKKEDQPPDQAPVIAPDPEPAAEPAPRSEPRPEPKPESLPEIPAKISETDLPDPNSPEYLDMEEKAWITDLHIYIENENAIKRGLDYRAMANDMYYRYDNFKDERERENYLAVKMLESWREHDIICRKEAGVGDLEAGLDYKNDEGQIKWAKVHARAILRLVRLKMTSKIAEQQSWAEIIEPEVQKFILRRADRYAEPEKKQEAEALAGIPEATASKEIVVPQEAKTEAPEESIDQKEREAALSDFERASQIKEKLRRLYEELGRKSRHLAEIKEEIETAKKTGKTTLDIAGRKEEKEKTEDEIATLKREIKNLEKELKKLEKSPGWFFTRRLNDAFEKAYKFLGNREKPEESRGEAEQPKVKPEEVKSEEIKPETVQEIGTQEQAEKRPRESIRRGFRGTWNWVKERFKTFWKDGGFLGEFRQAEMLRRGTKYSATNTESMAGLIKTEWNIDDPDAVQDIVGEFIKSKGADLTAEEFIRGVDEVSKKRKEENDDEKDYIIKTAIGELKERTAKARGQATSETVLTQENLKQVEDEMRAELDRISAGAMIKDARGFAKVMRKNLDKNWWLRYMYGAAEVGVLGWLFYQSALKSLGRDIVLAPEGTASVPIPEGVIPEGAAGETRQMLDHYWGVAKGLWAENGVTNPTNEQIMEVTKTLAKDNNVAVPEWGIGGDRLHTRLPVHWVLVKGGLAIIRASLG